MRAGKYRKRLMKLQRRLDLKISTYRTGFTTVFQIIANVISVDLKIKEILLARERKTKGRSWKEEKGYVTFVAKPQGAGR